MDKDLLLTYCRYYKGEKECPFTDSAKANLWMYEKAWHNSTENHDKTLDDLLMEYIHAGLSDFSTFDNTPISLKAFLYNRWTEMNVMSPIDDFKKWYITSY